MDNGARRWSGRHLRFHGAKLASEERQPGRLLTPPPSSPESHSSRVVPKGPAVLSTGVPVEAMSPASCRLRLCTATERFPYVPPPILTAGADAGFDWPTVIASVIAALGTVAGALLTVRGAKRWASRPNETVETAVDAAFVPVVALADLLTQPLAIRAAAVLYAASVGGPLAAKRMNDAFEEARRGTPPDSLGTRSSELPIP